MKKKLFTLLALFFYSVCLLLVFVSSQCVLNSDVAALLAVEGSHIPVVKESMVYLFICSYIGLLVFLHYFLSSLFKSSGKEPDKNKNENKE